MPGRRPWFRRPGANDLHLRWPPAPARTAAGFRAAGPEAAATLEAPWITEHHLAACRTKHRCPGCLRSRSATTSRFSPPRNRPSMLRCVACAGVATGRPVGAMTDGDDRLHETLSPDAARRLAVDEFGSLAARAFGQVIFAAHRQGRLSPELASAAGVATGEHVCHVCGMLHWTPAAARRCCSSRGW